MGSLNLNYNSCKIDVRVAGEECHGSGFLYLTSPSCEYNYILTAKHILSEDTEGNPNPADITNLSINIVDEGGFSLNELYSNDIEQNLIFHDKWDIAILRIKKLMMPLAVRVLVKNRSEIENEEMLKGLGHPSFSRSHPIEFDLVYHPKHKLFIECKSAIKEINRYHGISGGGIFFKDYPYLISVISKYPFEDFEMNYLMLAEVDWDEINELLKNHHWHTLSRRETNKTRVTQDKKIIDLRDLCINSAHINLDSGLRYMRKDMIDDWFFDPLHYVDMCNSDFVLDYFSVCDNREKYIFHQMEVFYLPKESLVQRKAMIGNFIDRLLYTSAVAKLAPIMEKYISSRVYSARFNISGEDSLIAYGVKQWVKMNYLIDGWLDEGKGCLFKCDIVNYYDNISHKALIGFLREITADKGMLKCIDLLETMLSAFAGTNIYWGLPQNCDASALLATFYLSHVDLQIQAQAIEYCRFMDDIYFMAADYFTARNILQSLECELRRLNLSLNSSKVTCVRLDNAMEVDSFRNELSLYNHRNQQISQLLDSESLGRRSNGMALLIKNLEDVIANLYNKDGRKRNQRNMKFLLHVLCNHPITLVSYWNRFYKNLSSLVDSLLFSPVETPLICRLISCVNRDRNLDNIKRQIAEMLMRKHCDLYPWQAYHYWLLMAYLKYTDNELIRHASTELEQNDSTHRIENAAIIIYLTSVKASYSRVIMNMLGKHVFHGYIQTRAALIACRSLNPESVAAQLPDEYKYLKTVPEFLYRNKEKDLVLMGNISSYLFKPKHHSLFFDLYSGI